MINQSKFICFIINFLTVVALCLIIQFGSFLMMSQTRVVYTYQQDSALMQEVLSYFFHSGQLIHFNSREKQHLHDVKNLITFGNIALFFSVAILAARAIFGRNTSLLIRKTVIYCLIVQVILLALTPIYFKFLFHYFHQLFFSSNSWIFPAQSTIINLFPLQRFYSLTIIGLSINIGLCLLLLLLIKFKKQVIAH